jgi:two-component system response regulator NreC
LAAQETVREIDNLSAREREVLRLIALGYTNPQIAEYLVLSVRTIETHRAHLARKLGAESRAQLVRHALDYGLLNGD